MSSAGDHAADDGSLARSTGGAAARGAMLIAAALIIGLVLMAFALDDPQSEITSGDTTTDTADDTADDSSDDTTDSSDSTDSSTEDSSNGDADVATSQPPETIPEVEESEGVHPPSEVNVLVANGTGGKGVAGAVADKLKTRGYIANAANAPSTAAAIIYYRIGYADDAREVASILGAPPDIITPAPGDGTIAVAPEAVSDGRLTDANVVVIVGADNAVPQG